MKISDHIKQSIDALDRRELDQAMLSACIAVDGTAKKCFPEIDQVGARFRAFIKQNLDIVEVMFGGINLEDTIFPFTSKNGKFGIKFCDIVYEIFRCHFVHGDELPDGYGISFKTEDGNQHFQIQNQSMTLPESCIAALGIICVLNPVNDKQKIGSYTYHYRDPVNVYVIDRWWGNLECARKIIDFENCARVMLDFSSVYPKIQS